MDVLLAAALNNHPVQLFVKPFNLEITEASLVEVVRRRGPNIEVFKFLYLTKPDNINIQATEAVLVAVAKLKRKKVLELLLAKCKNTQIPEAILVAAAGNGSSEVLQLLLLVQSENIHITEAVLVAAVSQGGMNTSGLGFLLAKWDNIQITKLVLMAAVNHRQTTKEMPEPPVSQSDSIQIT